MSWASAIASEIRLSTISVTRLAAVRIWTIWALMLSVERGRAAHHLGQHLGAAEDDAKRVLQVVGDGTENLALEGVGALQPRPLRRQPRIGLGQLAGALAHAVLEVGVGLLQLLVEDDVVEGDRKPAREDLDQRAVGVGKLLRGLQQHHELAAAAGADIEHRAAGQELVVAAPERLLDDGEQIVVERR